MADPTEKLSIVIPVYNEERTLGLLLEKVAATPLSIAREIVIVNDGSRDSSGDIIGRFMAQNHDFEVNISPEKMAAKALPSAMALPPPPAASLLFRMAIWNMSHGTSNAVSTRS